GEAVAGAPTPRERGWGPGRREGKDVADSRREGRGTGSWWPVTVPAPGRGRNPAGGVAAEAAPAAVGRAALGRRAVRTRGGAGSAAVAVADRIGDQARHAARVLLLGDVAAR